MAHEVCLQDGWPIHLANKFVLFGIIDDCLSSESTRFHCVEEECLMCWLSGRYNSDELYYYHIEQLGKYCDVFLCLRYIDPQDPANNILDEIHLTCVMR